GAEPALVHGEGAGKGAAPDHIAAALGGEDRGGLGGGAAGGQEEGGRGGALERDVLAAAGGGGGGSGGGRGWGRRAGGMGRVAGVGEFGEFGVGVADCEGFDGAGEVALHEGGDGGGIDAAGEEHAEGDVAHEAHADGFFQAVAAFADPGGVVAGFAALAGL